MNRLVALFLCVLLGTVAVDAQFRKSIDDAPRHRAMVGIGALPLASVFDMLGEDLSYDRRYTESILDYYYESNKVYFGNTVITGAIFADYGYRVGRWLDVGMNISYTGYFTNVYNLHSHKKVGNDNYFYISATPMARLMWGRTDYVNWYSGVGMGLTLMSDSDYSTFSETAVLTGHFTLIGLMFGRGKVFGFSEYGFGVYGLFSAGIGIRF